MQYKLIDGSQGDETQKVLKAVLPDFIKTTSSVKHMIATASDLYILFSDKTIQVFSIENLSEGPIVKTDKLENFGG